MWDVPRTFPEYVGNRWEWIYRRQNQKIGNKLGIDETRWDCVENVLGLDGNEMRTNGNETSSIGTSWE